MHLEHVNITVNDPKDMAQILMDLFDWKIRWEGSAKDNGYTVHVGDDDGYLALYSPRKDLKSLESSYVTQAGLNHIGVVVPDIKATEARVVNSGYTPHNHADYEPGVRFYFDGPEGIEFEVVSYA
ncbi:VOC family protein [Cognatishimia sp. SS12]|uniref:VOC family protein n=1 Tax=Cognatishimia sp. SS12 TaxID=2979465 RepID=UPI003FA4A562